jgi:hypothetical protein
VAFSDIIAHRGHVFHCHVPSAFAHDKLISLAGC